MAVAPDSIRHVVDDIVEKYRGPGSQDEVLSGIVHGPFDTPGFHWSLNELRGADALDNYSLDHPRNLAGARANPDFASALDFHFGPEGMKTVTTRLIASAKDLDDPRLDGVFEFCGTTNGSSPHPFTVATGTDDPDNTQGWDDTHVTHVHLSFWRDKCHDFDAIKGVADVIAGLPLGAVDQGEDDVYLVTDKDPAPEITLLVDGADVYRLGPTALSAYRELGVTIKQVSTASYDALRARAKDLPD